MKTAEEMTDECFGKDFDPVTGKDVEEDLKFAVAEKMLEYGDLIKEACALIAEHSWGGPQTAENIRRLELP